MIFEPVVQFYKGFKDLNSYRIVTKTKFWGKQSTILLWPIKHKMFLRPSGRALSYFFFFKIAYFIRFRMISVGGRDMNYFPGCTKGSADAQKDPQMHERIRGCTKGSADAQKDSLGVPPLYARIIKHTNISKTRPDLAKRL